MSETASIITPMSNDERIKLKWKGAKLSSSLALLLLALSFWQIPAPSGLTSQAWHLVIIFFITIAAIIVKPMPMGAVSIVAIVACVMTNTLPIEKSLNSFSSPIVWLVLVAFLIAKGFIKTGLGARISYYIIMLLGRNTIGLSYGLIASELLLSPFIPSNTARGAGVIFPILSALNKEYESQPNHPSRKKIGAYLTKVCFQANVITSAMFITAMAANPLIVSIAASMGYQLSWITWALAALIPGLFCLLLLPFILFLICPPEIKYTPQAPLFAKKKIESMGTIKLEEIFMLGTFFVLLTLWIFGPGIGVEATSAALLGLAILLFFGVLSWDEIISEKNAWNTFIWLAVLLMLVKGLSELGVIAWFSDHMQIAVSGLPWQVALVVLVFVYYYAHYFFASMTAHVSSLFSAFAIVAIAAGTPPMIALLLFAAMSSLSGGLTHFSTGTAPVYFSSGYVTLKEWWKIGWCMSVIHILVWLSLGIWWWKAIGLW
jgi:DASS family divalent anion:Na+ symporter